MSNNSTIDADINYIKERIPIEDLYNCLAEEAAELSSAASKLLRIARGINPASKSAQEVYENLVEEFTDVLLIARDMLGLDEDKIRREWKLREWHKRIDELRELKERELSWA